MKLISTLKADFAKIDTPSITHFIKSYLMPRGSMIRYVVWFRILQKVKERVPLKIVFGVPAYLIHRHYEFKYGIHINTNIEVGPGLYIVHGDGVYLNCKKIGENFTCFQGVTLGVNSHGEKPSVGDNVTVYAGSIVIGDLSLENDCIIGANSFVNKTVGPGEIVAGNPAKKIK